MQGPYSNRAFNFAAPTEHDWESRSRLVRGETYRITVNFVDAEGDVHPVGEEWVFIGGTFNKFDDEVGIWVQTASGEEWKIPLIWQPDRQQVVIERFRDYVARVG